MLTLFSPLPPQKLIRMNMPVTEAGTVHFTTTLFALIRESLSIKMGPGKSLHMDQIGSFYFESVRNEKTIVAVG